MVSSEFNYIEYLYIHVGMDSIVFNDDINFQFDARAMTSTEFLIMYDVIKILCNLMQITDSSNSTICSKIRKL